MSRKKGIPLDQFLKPDTNITNWAEEDEDLGPEGSEAPPFPAAPKHQSAEPAHDSHRASSDLPDQPPWKVYIGNVPYELTPRDIEDVFKGLQIRDTHMLTHRDSGKLKGVFVEFGSKSDLQSALQQNGVSVLGRSLRIDVAEAKPERSRGFSDRGPADSRDRGGYGFDRPEYSSGNRLDERRSSGYSRDYEGDRGRGSGFDSYVSRGYDQREDRRGFGSNYDQDERRGSFRDRPKGDYGGFSGARDEGSGRWGRAPSDAPSGGKSQELSGLESMSSEHKSLSLQPTPSGASATSDGPPKPKANPFGNAKPVDTVAKLKELEERDAKRKAEEATRRRDAAAVQRQTAPEPTPPGPSLPTKILQPTGLSQAGAQPAQSVSEQPSQRAQTSAQQQPQQGPASSTAAERQHAPQAIASKPKAIPSPAAAPAAQQLPRPSADSGSAEPAPPAATRAPAWGKPAQPSKAVPSQAAHEPPADTPQPPKFTAPDQTNQANKSSTITETDQQHAQPQPPTQSSRQLQAEQPQRLASQQAQQGQAKPPGFDDSPGAPTAAAPKSAWGKPSRVEGGSQPTSKPGSASPQPSAWGKGQSQTAAPHSTQNGSHAASGSRAQETSSREQQQQQSAKQEQPSAEPAGQAGTTGQHRPVQAQAAKPSNAWGAPRQGNNANQSHHAATGTQFGSLDAADLQPPAAARPQTATNRPGPHSRRDAPPEQQQQSQVSKATTAEVPVLKSSAPAPVSTESQDPEQGWTDVASTRGAAGQDGAGDSSEGGRGRGGRGRGRGRYSNAGPVDSFRGRGPGRGRGYGNQGGRGGPGGRGPPGRGPPGRGYQGAPPPGLQQGVEVEQGWEQAGRSEGPRANRGRGRGSSAPQILQHQDRPTNAWGQQGSFGAQMYQQHDGKTPPGLAAQPESKATEAQNMFELLNEGADA